MNIWMDVFAIGLFALAAFANYQYWFVLTPKQRAEMHRQDHQGGGWG